MKPLVIIPGLGGSILVRKGHEHRKILNRRVLMNRWLTPASNAKDMSYMYDGVQKRFVGADPAIRPYDVGGIDGVCNIITEFGMLPPAYQAALDGRFCHSYFKTLCTHLQHSHDYRPHHSLAAVTYDFRLVLDPDVRMTTFADMKRVIEGVARTHRHTGVVVLAHSVGGILLKWFVSSGYVSQGWLDDHVDHMVMVNVPWGGSLSALRAVVCGEYYIPQLHRLFRDDCRRNSGLIMCIPNRRAHDASELLMTVADQDIRIDGFGAMVRNNAAFQIHRDLYEPHMDQIFAPTNISTHMILSTDSMVASGFVSASEHELAKPRAAEPGDGLVSHRSLCAYGPFDRLRVSTFSGAGHVRILKDDGFIQMVAADLRVA